MVAAREATTDDLPGPHAILGPYRAAFAFFKDPIGYLDGLFSRYGNLVWVKTPPMATPPAPDFPGTLFLYGPELLQQVLMKHDAYHRVAMSLSLYPSSKVSPRQEPVTRIMTGLPFLQKDEHRKHRRLMMPAFHKQAVQAYHDDMVSATMGQLGRWRTGQLIDVSRELLVLTMRISALTLFGQESMREGEQVGAAVEKWIDFVMSLGHLFPYDLPGFGYRRWLDLSREIETATRSLIAEKGSTRAGDQSLLSMLIRARDEDGSTLSEDDLIGHISLLLWGSRDASVYAVTWTLFLLSQHPDVMATVAGELDDVLAGNLPTVEQLDQLPVLERAIKESLRLLPPFPVIHRVSDEYNDVGGHSIPPLAEVVMSIYHTHRMPEIYPDPLVYRPERWLTMQPSIFEFSPFSAGPRMCIGSSYGMQEVKVILALVLQRYRLELASNARIDRLVHVTLTPKQGMPMIVRPPDGQFEHGVGGVRGTIREMVTLPE